MTHPYVSAVKSLQPVRRLGYVRAVSHDHIEADGPLCALGDICEISLGTDDSDVLFAEVASVCKDKVVLVPLESARSVLPNAPIVAQRSHSLAPVGDPFAGRIVDAMAAPIDLEGPIHSEIHYPLGGEVLKPLERAEPIALLQTGFKAIDGLLPIGPGQRIGVFAASGVGKTTFIKQLAEQIACDRCVLCLVGERGREVESIWKPFQAAPNRNKYTCVAATSDISAPLRARAVRQALCLAEYWRDRGEHVLLIIDSVTRFAMALREIGLAAGAPPTLRAYTPNVFSALPRIVERCGAARVGGAITAIMTVLSETDDVEDPISEFMKSLLDGHVVLSRQLAEQGHFPAIDVTKSISRQSENLMSEDHHHSAHQVLAMLSAYDDAKVMVESGIYRQGTNRLLDQAIKSRGRILDFLKQDTAQNIPFSETSAALRDLAVEGGANE